MSAVGPGPALRWIEGRTWRFAAPGTAVICALAGLTVATQLGTLGPTACGWVLRQGEPLLLPLNFARPWFAEAGALLLIALGAWAGSRVRQDEAFLSLTPLTPGGLFGARVLSGLGLLALATLVSGAALLVAGLNVPAWWPPEQLYAVYGAALGLLWMRGVVALAVAAALRRVLSPVLSLLVALGLSTALLFALHGGQGRTSAFHSDPFMVQLAVTYPGEAFAGLTGSDQGCAPVQAFMNRTAPTEVRWAPQPPVVLGMVGAVVALLALASPRRRPRT